MFTVLFQFHFLFYFSKTYTYVSFLNHYRRSLRHVTCCSINIKWILPEDWDLGCFCFFCVRGQLDSSFKDTRLFNGWNRSVLCNCNLECSLSGVHSVLPPVCPNKLQTSFVWSDFPAIITILILMMSPAWCKFLQRVSTQQKVWCVTGLLINIKYILQSQLIAIFQ